MLSLRSARSALRLAGSSFTRTAAVPTVSRVVAFSFRTFLTTVRVQEPAAKTKAPKAASAIKTKRTTTAAKEKTTVRKKSKTVKDSGTKRVQKTAPKAKPVQKFDRKLMRPPKKSGNSGYIVFMSQYMGEQRQLNKDTSVRDILTQAVYVWQGLSDAQKEVYAKSVHANKEEWEKRYEAWYRALPQGYFHQINLERKKNGKPALRRPKSMRGPAHSGYIYFFSDYYKTNLVANTTVPVAAKNAAMAWKALSQEERDRYNQRAREAMQDFLKSQKA